MPSTPRSGAHGTLRARLTVVLTVAFGAQAAAATVALAAVEARALQHQLDASLRAHAASEAMTAVDRADGRAHLHDAPRLAGDALDSSDKFAALYGASGAVLASTSTFGGAAPARASLPARGAFDLAVRGRRLRAVLTPMGPETEARWLLLAVPRGALDAAQRTLLGVMAALLAAALALAALLAGAIARWLTRDLDAIASAARAVADGALEARVGPVGGVREVRALAADLDGMIGRLASLVASQRRFISDAAHELRTPLTSLRGELELALLRPRTGPEYERALRRAHDDVLDLATLAEDLLALARARTAPVEVERASLCAAAARVATLVAPQAAARSVALAVRGEDGDVAIAPRDLERVLRNLVENAIRHAPDGSTVEVSTELAAGRASVAVADEGPGVPAEQAERVFEPFVRLHPTRSRETGAGLGLAIAREVARTHGGDVTLDVGAPRGARFVLWLPRSA